jgi:ssDNA thymidine ADP-ribosyltransferase, DarT
MHFTHVQHLKAIIKHGLLSDNQARTFDGFQVEVGNQGIKEQRRRRLVPVDPGGAVADYVPFYFAPRSPMMYAIEKGNVPTYLGGCDELIYLASTVERLIELDLRAVFTDRNAVLEVATFGTEPVDLDSLVDWQLMTQLIWKNTPDEPDRRERRMAECLIHGRVPWEAFQCVVARNQACALRAEAQLASAGQATRVFVRPGWYF